MLKLTNLYIGNVGTRNAWYPGITLPFTNTKDNRPTSTIVNLINQGGKTTLLSCLFSLFDTNTKRFLQHLTDAGKKFEDYFDQAGVPGMIIAEWDLPESEREPRRLVTGQFVTLDKSTDSLTNKRLFFSFKSTEKISLESIPAPNLAESKPLRSHAECLAWLHQCEQSHPGNFQSFSSQEEWQKHLISLGIDIELLKNQVDFNRKEGAMDDAFLDFKTEKDFIERFLTITLKPATAHETQQLVSTLCRKMSSRKLLQDTHYQMQRLSDVFEPFARQSEEYKVLQSEQEMQSAVAASALVTLQRHHERCGASQKEEQYAAEVKKSEADELMQHAQKHRADREAYEAESHRRSKDRAQAALTVTTASLEAAEIRCETVEAARLLGETNAIADAIATLDLAIAQANEEAEPYRIKARRSGSLYRYQLREKINEVSVEHSQAENVRIDLVAKLRTCVENQKRLASVLNASRMKGAEARLNVEAADKKKADLQAAGVLQPNEGVDDAIKRIKVEQKAALSEAIEAENRLGVLEKREGELRDTERDVRDEKTALARKKADTQARLQKGEAEFSSLASNRVLSRAADADTCNPDSPMLPPKVRSQRDRDLTRWRDSQLGLARLREGDDSYRITGLFGRDPDVSEVLRYLRDNNVSDAQPFAQYLANTVLDKAAARTLALSDPARFLGVTVPDEKAVARCREVLAHAKLDLSRPVTISAYTHTPMQAGTERTVAGPSHDALWNREAASDLAGEIVEKIEKSSQHSDELRRQYEETFNAEKALEKYIVEFGNGELDRLKELLTDIEVEVDALQSRHDQLSSEQEILKTERKTLQDRTKSLRTKVIPEIDQRLGRVDAYEREYAKQRSTWLADQLEHEHNAAQVEAELEVSSDSIEQIRAEIDALRIRSDSLVLTIKGLERELVYVTQFDDHANPVDSMDVKASTLDSLKAVYEADTKVLEAIEQKQSASLVATREEKRKSIAEKNSEYARRFPSTRFNIEVVNALIGQDYDHMSRAALAEVTHLKEAEKKAGREQGILEHQYTTFMKGRKFPAHSLSGVTELSDVDVDKKIQTASAIAETAEARALAAKAESDAANERAKAAKQAEKSYAILIRHLSGFELDTETALLQLEKYTDPQTVDGEVSDIIVRLRDIQSKTAKMGKRVDAAYESVRRIANDEAFSKCDLDIAVQLRDNSAQHAAEDAERIRSAIQSRIDSINHELERMQQDFDRATNSLAELTNDAVRIIKRAVEAMTLPPEVPLVGGNSVFKMKTAVLNMNSDDRRKILSGYMEELVADANIPETGAKLAAQAFMRLGDGRINLRLLKPVAIVDEQYVAIDRMSHSGAEKISTALFLYFVSSKLRAEARSGGREGGILVLDNPFAKATSRRIWEVIVGMAAAMGLQLIIATGVNEEETLSVFARHLRLTKSQQDRATGRLYVQVADFHYLGRQDT